MQLKILSSLAFFYFERRNLMRKKPYERIIKEVQKMLEEKIDIRSISTAMNMSEETINEIKSGCTFCKNFRCKKIQYP